MEAYHSAHCWTHSVGSYIGQSGYQYITTKLYHGQPAHRVAYQIFYDIILERHQAVHHNCRNRACYNPAHLTVLTRAEHASLHSKETWTNPETRPTRKRKTHCRQGHKYTGEINPRGEQICRPCQRESDRRRYAKRQANPEHREYIRNYQRDYNKKRYHEIYKNDESFMERKRERNREAYINCDY